MRAVAAAIQEARNRGKDVTLGIIPLGTGNLLARNLRLPITDIAACINIALNGTHQLVDAIDMSAESAEGDVTNHMFYVMSGAGFDALVMNDANEDLKARIGWLAYVHSGLNHIFGHSHRSEYSSTMMNLSKHVRVRFSSPIAVGCREDCS